jgi:hypothetical protein
MTRCALFVAIALCILLLPQSVGSALNDVAETHAIVESACYAYLQRAIALRQRNVPS